MNAVTLIQQQAGPRVTPTPQPAPELFWTAQQIADATNSRPYVGYIEANWPIIAAACAARGFWDRENAAAIAGTVTIETAHSFCPVMETYYLFGGPTDYDRTATSEYNRTHKPQSGYWPHFGRGWIELTWESNYREAGDALGIDLVTNPDLAMELPIAADVLSWFWGTRFIPQFARRHDWREVRRRVQGADAGLNELITYAESLLAT